VENNERALCQWFKCFNEVPEGRNKYCCDRCGTADRKHRQRKLAKERVTIAALKPDDHALIESVVDRATYRAALETIKAEGERVDRSNEGRPVNILHRSSAGLSESPEKVRADVRDVFLEDMRRRRRRDSSSPRNEVDQKKVTAFVKTYDAETERRRRANAAYKKTFQGNRPPKVLSVEPPSSLPVCESNRTDTEPVPSITGGSIEDAVAVRL